MNIRGQRSLLTQGDPLETEAWSGHSRVGLEVDPEDITGRLQGSRQIPATPVTQ